MLIVIAMITTPNIHEISACRTAARRISLACRLVSDTYRRGPDHSLPARFTGYGNTPLAVA